MKSTVFVLLLAVSLCQISVTNKDVHVNNSIFDIIKCLIDKSLPLREDIVNLIEAIKEGNLLEIITIINKLKEDGEELYLQCIEPAFKPGPHPPVRKDWKEFAKCILRNIDEHNVPPLLSTLYGYCRDQEYTKVETEAYRLLKTGAHPIVHDCYNDPQGH